MQIDGLKVLECQMSNLNLKKLLNPKFLELLEKEMDNVEIVHIGIISGSDENQNITSLAHIKAQHAKNDILNIKVKEETDLNKILDVIKSFDKEE